MLSIILGIIGVIALIIGILCVFDEEARPAGIVTAVVAVILIVCSCVTFVGTGKTGIVSDFGKVSETTLDSGLHIKKPWSRVIKMDNRTQKLSLTMVCFSSDIQEVTVDCTINHKINKENANIIYKTIGKNYVDTAITPNAHKAMKNVIGKYTAESLVNSREQLTVDVEKMLTENLKQYNVELVDISIENIDFTDVFTNAVEEKQVAQQNKLKAEADAERKIVEAEANAKAKIINAEAEAKANKTISDSLTDDILYQEWLKKWDGVLPYVAGSDANIIIDSLAGAKATE